jgi:TonB family protein
MRRILASSVVLSSLLFSAAAHAATPATDAASATTTRPLSTGVKLPRVLSATDVQLGSTAADALVPNSAVVLTLSVDQNGQPQDVQVVKSPSPLLDEPVSAAVRQFRFSPATLDNKPVATEMTLTVIVQR